MEGVNGKRVREIFNQMEYGKSKNNKLEANVKEWIKSNSPFAASKSIGESVVTKIYNCVNHEEVLGEVFTQNKIIYDRGLVPNKFSHYALEIFEWSNEIENHIANICMLEAIVRGILPKDTKKSISVFIDCLRYYSGYSFEEIGLGAFCTLEIPDDCSLDLLGHIFAMLMGRPHEIYFEMNPKIAIVLSYILKLAPTPTFAFRIHINATSKKMNSYIKWYYSLGSYPDDRLYLGYTIPREKIPMLIFNDADLDSAVECLIDAAWAHQGLVPWNVGTVLIQEDIFDEFTSKLKVRMDEVRVGDYTTQADVVSPILMHGYRENYEKYMKEAERKGIPAYHADKDKCGPMVTIGGSVRSSNVISKDDDFCLAVALLPFRNANEAVALANNSRNSFASCVWTENIGLANEISKKLKVGTVWINTHGHFKPDFGFTIDAEDRPVTLGGPIERLPYSTTDQALLKVYYLCASKQCLIDQKTIDTWKNLSVHGRAMHLKDVAIKINKAIPEIINSMKGMVSEKEIIQLVKVLMQQTSVFTTGTNCNHSQEYEIKTYIESLGIIMMTVLNITVLPLVITAILHGNIIIIPTETLRDNVAVGIYGILALYLPNKLISAKCDSLLPAAKVMNIMIDGYTFGKTKIIWTNVGHSFS